MARPPFTGHRSNVRSLGGIGVFCALALAAACGHVEALEDRPCPCADGYTCCDGRCLANGTACASGDAGSDADVTPGPSISCADRPVAFVRSDVLTWTIRGTDPSDYDFDHAPSETFERLPTVLVKSKSPTSPTDPHKFGTLATDADPGRYAGARLRFSAVVRGAALQGDGALWLGAYAVDGGAAVAFDSMEARTPLVGDSGWNRYAVTIDVPTDPGISLSFGALTAGAGAVWTSDARLEVVTPSTRYVPDPSAWIAAGAAPWDYTIDADVGVNPCGRPTAHIASRAAAPSGDGVLLQSVAADGYAGKRVLLSAYVRASNLEHGGLWMKVYDRAGGTIASDAMDGRPLASTSDFTPYRIVLDVPPDAISIFFGLRSMGTGEAWLEGLGLEVVDGSVPTTN
jgi:hypothetical protein